MKCNTTKLNWPSCSYQYKVLRSTGNSLFEQEQGKEESDRVDLIEK